MGGIGWRPRAAALVAIVAALLLIVVSVTAEPTAFEFFAGPASPDEVVSGTLRLSTDRSAPGALANVGRLVPGDTVARQVTLTNDGAVPFTYTIGTDHLANTALWTGLGLGLQVSVHRAGALLYSGPLGAMADVPGSITLAPGAHDPLVFVFTLPPSAGNAMQGLRQDLVITYTAQEGR
jgi:hypothetical protein